MGLLKTAVCRERLRLRVKNNKGKRGLKILLVF